MELNLGSCADAGQLQRSSVLGNVAETLPSVATI